jgi:hypothetical protein
MDNYELTDIEDDIIARLEKRIPYNPDLFGEKSTYDLILEDLVLNARTIGLSRVFPFYDYSQKTLPERYADWQYRCAIELYNLADKTGFVTYSENGLSWGKLTDGVSKQLLEEITSKAGIPSKVSEDYE